MLGYVRRIIAETVLPDLLWLLKSFILQKRRHDVAMHCCSDVAREAISSHVDAAWKSESQLLVARARHLKSGLVLWRISQAFLLFDGQVATGFLGQHL
jgi:hypothetical protein